jgi:ribosomal protein S18 acetylase RimI-like enzyme
MQIAAAALTGKAAIRPATPADLDALIALENAAFGADRISRRGFRRFLVSPSAVLVVCEADTGVIGYALILFRDGSALARLYSIALAPSAIGRGMGELLLVAAEEKARERGAAFMRLEVNEINAPALALYRKAGYREFGRRSDYYADGGHALRFEKRLAPRTG